MRTSGVLITSRAESAWRPGSARVTHIDRIGYRAGRAAVRSHRLGAGVHIHSRSIQLDGCCHLVGVSADNAHEGLVRRKNIDLPERSAEGGGHRNGMADHGNGGEHLVI